MSNASQNPSDPLFLRATGLSTSVAVARSSDGLQTLGSAFNNQHTLDLLETHADKLIPFVGAGLSCGFDYPTWHALLCELADAGHIRPEIDALVASGRFEEAAERVEQAVPTLFDTTVQSVFEHRRLARPLDPESPVRLLARLTHGVTITTNFDRVIESAFEDEATPFEHIFAGAQIRDASGAIQFGERVLLKLHGDYRAFNTRVLTLTEYVREYGHADPDRVDLNLPLPSVLGQALTARPLLFLGCSLEHDRTTRVIAAISQRHPGTRHFALLPEPADFDSRARELDSWRILPLFYPRGEYARVQSFLQWLLRAAQERAAAWGRSDWGSTRTGTSWNRLQYLDTCAERFGPSGQPFVVVNLQPGSNSSLAAEDDGLVEHDLLTRPPHRVVVAAEPGAGKTSLLKRLAGRLANRTRLTPGPPALQVPILVSFRSADQWDGDLMAAISNAAAYTTDADRRRPSLDQLTRAFAAGEVVLLLDGLNEIISIERRRAVVDLLVALSTKYQNLAMVVSCRARGFDDAIDVLVRSGFTAFTIAPTTDRDVREYLGQRGLSLSDIANTGWRRLPRTFQALSVVAAIRANTVAADTWVSALQEYVRSLWAETPPRATTVWTKASLHAVTELAVAIHRSGGAISADEAKRCLGTHLDRGEPAGALFEQLCGAAILSWRDPSEPVSFDHEQLRFYFVALHLTERWRLEASRARAPGRDESLAALLESDAEDPALSEPYSFAIGLLALNPGDIAVLTAALRAVDRNPLLAAKCYGQMPRRLKGLAAQKRQAYLTARRRAFMVLGTNWAAAAAALALLVVLVQFVSNVTGRAPLPNWYYWLMAVLTPLGAVLRPEQLSIESTIFILTVLLAYIASLGVGLLLNAYERYVQRRWLQPVAQTVVWLDRKTGRQQLRAFSASLGLPLRLSGTARLLDGARHHLMDRKDLLLILRHPARHEVDQVVHALGAVIDTFAPEHVQMLRLLLNDDRMPVVRAAVHAAFRLAPRYPAEVTDILTKVERLQPYHRRLLVRRAIDRLNGVRTGWVLPRQSDWGFWLRHAERTLQSWYEAVASGLAELWKLERTILGFSFVAAAILMGLLIGARACG